MKNVLGSIPRRFLFLLAGLAILIFTSPKWTISIAPYLGLFFVLRFFRQGSLKSSIFFGGLGLVLLGMVNGYGVIPIPSPFYYVVAIIIGIKSILPYLLDRWLSASKRGWLGTLIFPAAGVSLEYFDAMTGAPTWSSIANTQFQFLELQQLAAYGGIWLVSFMVLWSAPLINLIIDHYNQKDAARHYALGGLAVYIAVFIIGFGRLHFSPRSNNEVDVAAITVNNNKIMEQVYQDEYGESIILPLTLSQTSPMLQKVNQGVMSFIADPDNLKFKATREVLSTVSEELISKVEIAADRGARMVSWSEAACLLFKEDEAVFMNKLYKLAKDREIHLIAGFGVMDSEAITNGGLVLTNKVVTISPEGELLNTYLKTNPVPFAEPDYGSDGILPVMHTDDIDFSVVICYDADFNTFMKQVGINKTQVLFVPSGDWYQISPYHTHMAVLQGIANGSAIVRPVSRGLSVITDSYGRILASDNFFTSEDHILLSSLPTATTLTWYNRLGDFIAIISVFIVLIAIVAQIRKVWLSRGRKTMDTPSSTDRFSVV